jgi:hypothetical protein
MRTLSFPALIRPLLRLWPWFVIQGLGGKTARLVPKGEASKGENWMTTLVAEEGLEPPTRGL